MFRLLLHTIDPCLGRLDFSSLTQQAQMEILVAGFAPETKRRFYEKRSENFKDACDWSWVKCDAANNITKFNWSRRFENTGTIDLAFVPETVTDLQFAEISASGFLDVEKLPQVLKILRFAFNEIRGSVNCAKLPPELEIFDGNCNLLTGSLDLHLMPATVKEFLVQHNHMEGQVKLSGLSPVLSELTISGNALHGEIESSKPLPERLLRADISNTVLQGKFEAKWVPKRSKSFRASYCNLEGSVALKELPNAFGDLVLSHNRLRGSLELQYLKQNLWFLSLHHNQLSGTLDFQKIPKRSAPTGDWELRPRIIHLGSNHFSGSIVIAREDEFEFVFLDNNRFTGNCSIDASVTTLDISSNPFDSLTLRGRVMRVFRDEAQNIKDETGIPRDAVAPLERDEREKYVYTL